MSPTAHATLSPSSAHRWIECPASVRLIADTFPDGVPGSVWTTEGTHAHTVAEAAASARFGGPTDEQRAAIDEVAEQVSAEAFEEMREHAEAYADLLVELVDDRPAHVLLEQRFQTGIRRCWGTSDAVIVSDENVHVVDYKYGRGVPVQAEGNAQLRLYALGAARTLSDLYGFTEASYTVHQPRLGLVSTESTSVADLERWASEVVEPAARLALEGADRFGPSEQACRFCPMSGRCRAQLTASVIADFGDPAVLSPTEIGQALHHAGRVEQWAKAIRETALTMAYEEGTPIPGWKVVRSGGRRVIADPGEAIDALVGAGLPRDKISRPSLQPLTALDRLAGGRKALDEILGDLVQVSPGRESLVPEDDKREAVTLTDSARADFGQSEV